MRERVCVVDESIGGEQIKKKKKKWKKEKKRKPIKKCKREKEKGMKECNSSRERENEFVGEETELISIRDERQEGKR